jgi:hypothetical protein
VHNGAQTSFLWCLYRKHNSLSFFPLIHKNVYQFTCTKQKIPDGSEVHRLFQNCGSFEWNLHHIILLASGIWTWLLNFWKIFGCLALTVCLDVQSVLFTVNAVRTSVLLVQLFFYSVVY